MESREYQRKYGRKWETVHIMRDGMHKEEIHELLMKELISKYLWHATYIRRIVDRNNYDGTREVTVYYDNDSRAIYTLNF